MAHSHVHIACGLQCRTQITLHPEHCFRYQMEVKQREKTGEKEHVSGPSVSHLWWDSEVFPSIHSCTSKQMPVSLFHFASGYEPPGRLWDPPGVRREDSIPVGTPCFPPHIHSPGQRQVVFSIRVQPQIKISVVVHESKSDGTCCSPLKDYNLLIEVCLVKIFIIGSLIKAWIFWAGWSLTLIN